MILLSEITSDKKGNTLLGKYFPIWETLYSRLNSPGDSTRSYWETGFIPFEEKRISP